MCSVPLPPVARLVDDHRSHGDVPLAAHDSVTATPGRLKARAASDAPRIKGWTWSDWTLGDRHLQYGTLTIDSRGHAHFECLAYTNKTAGAEGWCAGFSLETAARVKLHSESPRQSASMSQPDTRYRWSFDFAYDASNFDRITRAVQQAGRLA